MRRGRVRGIGLHLAALAGVGLLVALGAISAKKQQEQAIREKHRAM